MSNQPIKVLLVDDDEDDFVVTRELLEEISGQRFVLDWANSYAAGVEQVQRMAHDVYLLDYRLGAHSGLEILSKAQEVGCRAPIIMLTGQGDLKVDAAAQAAGAADYLVKQGLDAKQLDRSIRYSLQQAKMLDALDTERRSLAERVKERTAELSIANAELGRAAVAKDEFLASMSHELRTPLTGILAMSEILVEQFYGPLNPKQLEFSASINESGNHLLELINDILDVAKVQAGKMELMVGPVDVPRLRDASLRLIKESADSRRLSVHIEMTEGLALEGDEKRLKQILVNLLSNAVKFTPEGGDIGLKISGDMEKSEITFEVWDTGIGLAPDHIKQLFQPFVQIDSSLSKQHYGTGLGLVLVDRMAKLHGGRVAVISEPGKGSRFLVILPWKPQAALDANDPPRPEPVSMARQAAQVAPAQEASAALILLVDDNEVNRMLHSHYLIANGFRVEQACDGAEAIAKATALRPDLILMDVQMPGMDGLEATRRLRRDERFRNTPIIALTALAMTGDEERCLDAGADCYFSKPAPLKKLVSTVKELLHGDSRTATFR